jgi:hypothetical protein
MAISNNSQLLGKFLIFIDGGDDAAMYPLENLLGITVAANGTMLMKFKSSIGGTLTGETDTVTLTITADTEKTVMQSIAKALADPSSDAGVIIADDVNSVYVDSNITACAITLDT